tara:strand:+ start:297 stop:632 length:336 start_codon:yes stop_codon:yes gene_type:complete
MKTYISDSLEERLGWEEEDFKNITAEITLDNTIVTGELIRFSYGKKMFWRILLRKEDVSNFIFNRTATKVTIIDKQKRLEENLINPQITLSKEVGNNYILIIEDEGSNHVK